MYDGLSEIQVLERRKKFGEHVIGVDKEYVVWNILISQFKSPIVYILLFIGFISLFFQEYIDFSLIVLVVALDVILGFFQEYSAKKTLAALNKVLKPTAVVIRAGKRKELDIRELVPDDVVILGAGDRIPADGVMIDGTELIVQEAILTGEEEALKKTPVQDHKLFMGSIVLSGSGLMHVLYIGANTQMGKIGRLIVDTPDEKTPMQQKLERFSLQLALFVLATCLLVFITGVLHGQSIFSMLRMAAILSTAAIPQGIAIAVTMILALGMRRILKKHGLVKRLASIETLGVTSVICIDKTGTLTEGVMQVTKTSLANRDQTLVALAVNNTRRTGLEVAIWEYLLRERGTSFLDNIFSQFKRLYDEPFDGEKKYSCAVGDYNGKITNFMVGAPDILLDFCNLDTQSKDTIHKELDTWAQDGLRVLGVAYKDNGDVYEKNNFSWAGLVGIVDPIRAEVKNALDEAQRIGIKVKIITGDYLYTAQRVATSLGFVINHEQTINGQELELLSDSELGRRIDQLVIFARVSPHQKQKIIRVLQENGEVVAMTGDGVNDAPALKKADIGIAVANACDVAKEASDLILLDNNFKTIVDACYEGRLIFYNIKKTIGYMLSNSFEEIVLIFGAFLLGMSAPLTIVQILWIKLICDGPPDLMLAFEPAEPAFMCETPQATNKKEILDNFTKCLIIFVSLLAGLLSLALFWFFGVYRGDMVLGRTVAFVSLAAVSLIYIFSYKSFNGSILDRKIFFNNKLLLLGVAYGFILLFVALYVPFFNRFLGTAPLSLCQLLLALGVGVVVTVALEVTKKFFGRKSNSS